MDAADAIRSRRTWKCFDDQPLTVGELEELFDLARWAPNHKLTQPWRSCAPAEVAAATTATAIAAYIVLLAAADRGLAGYWRTPEVLRDNRGTAALGIGPDEDVLGLLHLGHPAGRTPAQPARTATDDFVSYLD